MRRVTPQVYYTFTPALKLVSVPGYIAQQRLLLITDVTNNTVVYNFSDPNLLATFAYDTTTSPGSVITNITVAYNTTSDRRIKENIVDSTSSLDLLARIRVRDYNYIADPAKQTLQGFIAQELYEVYPQAVTVGGEDPKTHPWQVDYGKMTPLLVKSVQELKQECTTKDAEIANLKARAIKAEAETAQIKAKAAKAEIESAQTKARLDLLIRVWCEREPKAEICH